MTLSVTEKRSPEGSVRDLRTPLGRGKRSGKEQPGRLTAGVTELVTEKEPGKRPGKEKVAAGGRK